MSFLLKAHAVLNSGSPNGHKELYPHYKIMDFYNISKLVS